MVMAQWGGEEASPVIAYVFGIFINAVFISQAMLLVILKFLIIFAEERERRG